jgi:hypothetical protein
MTDIEKTENEITELRVKRDDVIAARLPRPDRCMLLTWCC